MGEPVSLTFLQKGAVAATGYLKSLLDPNKRRLLDEQIITHVLEEIPRIVRLLDERVADVRASGCTPEEANIIAHQVVEAQKATLDADKRRRLSNVLINGLLTPRWDKVKHRLLIRLTAELEEEHIAVLRREIRTSAEIQQEERAARSLTQNGETYLQAIATFREQQAIAIALDRELLARGLMNEVTKPKLKMQDFNSSRERRAVENVELVTRTSISSLGRDLLEYLRDPEVAE